MTSPSPDPLVPGTPDPETVDSDTPDPDTLDSDPERTRPSMTPTLSG